MIFEHFKTNKKFMKKILITFFITISLILVSWKYNEVKFDDPNKDKLLIELLKYVLEKGHYQSKEINDELSEKVFDSYLEILDPQKKYFLVSDFKEFKKYRNSLDDQWLQYDISFFNLTYDRIVQRISEVETMIPTIFEESFEFETQDNINVDFDNIDYSKNNKERLRRWRKQLKYSALDFYDIKARDQKRLLENEDYKEKSQDELLQEATKLVNDNINDIFDLMNDLQKKDWFSNYVNSFVSQYDPHTVYFKPEDKDRFDVNISGRFDGIGARLQKMSLSAAQMTFWAFAAVMGMSMSYIFIVYTGVSIVRVFLITCSTFAAMSIYGYTTKRDLTKFGSFLIMGLIGIILASIVNIFMQSSAMQFIISCVGVLVFVGLTAYDTQKIKSTYYAVAGSSFAGKAAIMGALTLYLDFINLFVMLMQLFGQRR